MDTEQWTFFYHHLPVDGYGYAGMKIGEALERVAPGRWLPLDMARNGRHGRHGQRRWLVTTPAVALCVPEWWSDMRVRRLIGYTMFESTRMPAGRVELINEYAEMCLVPCAWCAETFREQGVRVPLRIVPLGIDRADFYPLEREEGRGPYTFFWSGTPDLRKGWDLVYRAFWAAFGKSRDVRLILHFREMPRGVAGSNDANVEVRAGLLERPGLRALLGEADCFVFPSRGEGWGLPPREAAATGLPVIATNWGGLAEEIEHWALSLRVAGMRPAEFGPWDAGEVGEWAEPDFEHLVELMRWCFENQGAARIVGEQAARWLARYTPWERTARGIERVLG